MTTLKPALHIASAANERYYPGLEVLVTSALLHISEQTPVNLYIFDGGISQGSWERLTAQANRLHPQTKIIPLHFEESHFEGFQALSGSKLTYARLLLGELLPDVDRVIYLDSDIIICKDLDPLGEMPMEGRTALAGPDALIKNLSEDCPWLSREVTEKYNYFNAGVLVLDLNRWREKHYFQQALAALTTHSKQALYYDQTALNYILRDDVGPLPESWNKCVFSAHDFDGRPCNIHLTGEKPWLQHIARFDHYVWLSFYRDVISEPAEWHRRRLLSSDGVINKLHHYTARSRVTRFAYAWLIQLQMARASHDHHRSVLARKLRNGTGDFSGLSSLRREWQRRLDERRSPRALVA